MNGWAWAGTALVVWLLLGTAVGLLLGRAIRHNTQTPTPAVKARHTPRRARTDHHNTHRRPRR